MLKVDLEVDGILHIAGNGQLTAAAMPCRIWVELHRLGLGALRRNLDLDARNQGKPAGKAVIGNKLWEEWAGEPDNLNSPGEVRFFERHTAAGPAEWPRGPQRQYRE